MVRRAIRIGTREGTRSTTPEARTLVRTWSQVANSVDVHAAAGFVANIACACSF